MRVLVVMFFPSGLAGIWDKYATKYGWFKGKAEPVKKPEVSTSEGEAQAVLTETTPETSMATDELVENQDKYVVNNGLFCITEQLSKEHEKIAKNNLNIKKQYSWGFDMGTFNRLLISIKEHNLKHIDFTAPHLNGENPMQIVHITSTKNVKYINLYSRHELATKAEEVELLECNYRKKSNSHTQFKFRKYPNYSNIKASNGQAKSTI